MDHEELPLADDDTIVHCLSCAENGVVVEHDGFYAVDEAQGERVATVLFPLCAEHLGFAESVVRDLMAVW